VNWRKLGRVYVAAGQRPWQQTHAYCPTPHLLDGGDRIRVFCAFLDVERVGRLGWVDVDGRDPTRVLAVSERPALDVGAPGCFDDNGVTPLSICEVDGRLRLYYAGWQLGVRARYFLFTGLAESADGGESFQRVSEAPVLDRSDGELITRTGVHVRRGGAGWRMWYAGGSAWVGAKPTYDLRYLESADGVSWGRSGLVCLRPQAGELGFGRPSVLDNGGTLRMWYSLRTVALGYRIGYAESADGVAWERRDDRAGIDVSTSGWDSEMVCLSCLLPTPHGTYLFYNGNNYGETGFGVAVAEGLG
jgi:hypothetical protein